jgi:hypothetical protein
MKTFIIKIVVFSIIAFAVDKMFIFPMNSLPKMQHDKRLEMLLTGKINADIYIYGSSRASRDIVPKQIKDSLKSSCYNLGFLGSNIEFHNFLIQQTLKTNKKPKLIILTLDDKMLQNNPRLGFRMDKLYPLVKYDYVNTLVNEKNKKSKVLSYIFHSYRIKENFPGNFRKSKPHRLDSIFEFGSQTVSFRNKKFKDTTYKTIAQSYSSEEENKNLITEFTSIIETCEKNNIPLLLVYPPDFKPTNIEFLNRVKSLTNGNPLLVYSQNELRYKMAYYFSDVSHLNKKGAEIFTNEVIKYIIEHDLIN